MKLYDFISSPSPRRVRIFLAEKNVEVENIQVDLSTRAQLKKEFSNLNPWATVPVLELDNGTCISEAIACCHYIEEKFPHPPLMGENPEEKAYILMWEHRMEWDGFLAVAEYLRNTAERMEGRALTGPIGFEQIPLLGARGKKRIYQFYDVINRRLGETEYIAGEKFTVADITALVSLDFAIRAGIEFAREQTNIARWHHTVADRPSYKA